MFTDGIEGSFKNLKYVIILFFTSLKQWFSDWKEKRKEIVPEKEELPEEIIEHEIEDGLYVKINMEFAKSLYNCILN